MRLFKALGAIALTVAVAACGGGGGNAGTSMFGSGSGSSGTGTSGTTTTTPTAAYTATLDLQRNGLSVAQLSSTETIQAVARVVDAAGVAVPGVIVTFSGGTSPALTFAPTAATALTDANGIATVDVTAASATATGATTLTATASVAGSSYTASKAFAVSAGATTGTAAVPSAINFISALPSGTAIVIKGAGGNGRSESAVLQFRVVDASNTPLKGVAVAFQLNSNSGGAVLQQTQAASNADGLVSVTVNSGTSPASIVVSATVASTSIVAQSDTLIVSNSVAINGGFEVVASKYNLDGRKTGDPATITAYVRDQFGNPVPDGVAVNFTTDYGVVASSTLGGCLTTNGTCSVTFRVQDPRPPSGSLATVTGVVRVGSSTQLAQQIALNMAGSNSNPIALDTTTGAAVSTLRMTACTQAFEFLLSDGAGHATSAGTTIAAPFVTTGTAVTVKSGSPVLDQLDAGLPPTVFGIEVNATAVTAPVCRVGGTVQPSGQYFRLQYTSSGGIVTQQRIDLYYPQ